MQKVWSFVTIFENVSLNSFISFPKDFILSVDCWESTRIFLFGLRCKIEHQKEGKVYYFVIVLPEIEMDSDCNFYPLVSYHTFSSKGSVEKGGEAKGVSMKDDILTAVKEDPIIAPLPSRLSFCLSPKHVNEELQAITVLEHKGAAAKTGVTTTFSIQSTFGFETLDKAAALGLATATPLTDLRQYINSNLGFSNLKF